MWDEIDAQGAAVRLSSSSVNADGIVTSSSGALLAQAQRVDPSITLREYTLARVMASEAGSRPAAEVLTVGDCDLNRAAAEKRDLIDHVTGGSGTYGKQGSEAVNGRKRPVASSRDPSVRHLRAARLLLSGRARGIAHGARLYFDPRTQDAMWAKGSPSYMSAADILRKWTFALSVTSSSMTSGRRVVTFAAESAADKTSVAGEYEPVFPCGVDPWNLLPLRPASNVNSQAARYDAAKRVIASKGAERPPCEGDDTALAAWLGVGIATAAVATKGKL
jgi:hypothetical protein